MKVINTTDIICESVTQALEKTVFMEALPACDTDREPEGIIVSEIDFDGRISGRIQIAAEKEFARQFAENMTGLEQIEDYQYYDALKELANITCGLVLPMIADSDEEAFDMAVPYLTELSPLKWQDFIAEEESVLLDVEGCLVCVKLEFHNSQNI